MSLPDDWSLCQHLQHAVGEGRCTRIARLMNDEAVYAYRFQGKRFDCGSKLGYLQANVEYALQHPELATSFKAYLRKLSQEF